MNNLFLCKKAINLIRRLAIPTFPLFNNSLILFKMGPSSFNWIAEERWDNVQRDLPNKIGWEFTFNISRKRLK
jgi:hypothetical protein